MRLLLQIGTMAELGLALVDVYKNFTVTLYQSAPVHNELTGYDLILNDGAEGIGERIVGLVEKPSIRSRLSAKTFSFV